MARKVLGRRRPFSDQAQAALLGTLIGAGLFGVTFATVVTITSEQIGESSHASGDVRAAAGADRLADDLFARPGVGWHAPACPLLGPLTPELVQRFGLGAEPCDAEHPGTLELSHAKVQNLRKAKVAADPLNLAVDYAEARASLKLDLDFHLRGQVILPGAQQVLQSGRLDPNMRPLYIGDYEKQGTWRVEPAVVPEIAYLSHLVQNFQPKVYSALYHTTDVPFAADGDVIPDDNSAIKVALPLLLAPGGVPSTALYNVVVIGSDLESHEMNHGLAKMALEDWVKIAGGTLIVFGSHDNAYTWLESIFKIKQESASGSPSVDLPDHGLVTSPNALPVEDYKDHGKAWDFNAGADYEIVASHGGATLAASRSGTGDGRVIVTSFRPHDALGQGATGPCDPDAVTADCEGLRILHNMLSMHYAGLNFAYGPAIPTTVAVASARRTGLIDVPNLGPVEMSLWAFAW